MSAFDPKRTSAASDPEPDPFENVDASWYDARSGRRGDNIQMPETSIFRDQMTVRRLRLGAGLIMLCHLTLHLCMHALGNVRRYE